MQDDYHFIVAGVRYSVPWHHAGEEVRVSWTDTEVRAYSNGALIARHERPAEAKGRAIVTDPTHRPPGHRWFAKRMDDRFLALAKEHGPDVVQAMRAVLKQCKQDGQGFKRCKQLLDLAAEPHAVTLNDACRTVLEAAGEG